MAQTPADQPHSERRPESPFMRIFAASPTSLALLDEDGTILQVNSALTDLLDAPAEQLCGRRMIDLTYPDDRPHTRAAVARVEDGDEDTVELHKRLVRIDGESVAVRVTLLRLEESDGTQRRLAQIEDLTVREEQDRLRRQAHEDPLTRLANRRALHRELEVAEGAARRSGVADSSAWSLLFVDLDDFKRVNDTFGHQVGDAALVAVAERLTSLVRDEDVVCRFGGDEFVVLLRTSSPSVVSRTADRVRQALAEPLRVEGATLQLSGSVGSAIARPDDAVEQVLQRADDDMYRDKGSS